MDKSGLNSKVMQMELVLMRARLTPLTVEFDPLTGGIGQRTRDVRVHPSELLPVGILGMHARGHR